VPDRLRVRAQQSLRHARTRSRAANVSGQALVECAEHVPRPACSAVELAAIAASSVNRDARHTCACVLPRPGRGDAFQAATPSSMPYGGPAHAASWPAEWRSQHDRRHERPARAPHREGGVRRQQRAGPRAGQRRGQHRIRECRAAAVVPAGVEQFARVRPKALCAHQGACRCTPSHRFLCIVGRLLLKCKPALKRVHIPSSVPDRIAATRVAMPHPPTCSFHRSPSS